MVFLLVWCGVACLIKEWGPPCEYGDALNTVQNVEETAVFEVNTQGSRLVANHSRGCLASAMCS